MRTYPPGQTAERQVILTPPANNDSILTAAQHALNRGWSVFPVQNAGAHAKRPHYCLVDTGHTKTEDGKIKPSWAPLQEALPTEAHLRTWFGNPRGKGVAVVTGHLSGLVILDFDGAEGAALHARLGLPVHVRTGSGGIHTYFQHPGWRVSTLNSKAKQELGARWPGLDIRADGGYAVLPPSRNADGPYAWEAQDGAPEPLPLDTLPADLREFLGLLTPPAPPVQEAARRPVSSPRADDRGRVPTGLLLERALDRVSADGRNNSGFWLAGQLRDNGYSETEAQEVLREYAHLVPDTNTKGKREPYTIDDARKTVQSAFTRAPREEWERRDQGAPARVSNLAPFPTTPPAPAPAPSAPTVPETGPVVLCGDPTLYAALATALQQAQGERPALRQTLTTDELRPLVQDGRPVYAVTPTESLQRLLDASGVEWYALPALTLPAEPQAASDALADAMTDAYSQPLTGSLDFLSSGLLDEADARLKRGGNVYPTGLAEYDEAIGGGLYDGLHVLGGVTGGGKTALALAIAESNARAGRPVLYVTYEQSRYELWGRVISSRVGISLRTLRTGGTTDSPISGQLRNSTLYTSLTNEVAPWLSVVEGDGVEGGSWGIDRIAAHVKRLKAAHGVAPLVILDYLQRMPSGDAQDKRHQIDAVVMGLQVRLGRELNTPILLISSVGRGKYGELASAALEERLSVFKESGGVEYTAYTASLLYPLGTQHAVQLGLETPPLPGSGRAALQGLFKYLVLDLVKNREGAAPLQWIVKWYPATGRFELVQELDAEALTDGEGSRRKGR